ncbi:RNA polymerase sigma factor [Nocardia sp. BMG51109]|uniref:RNA polymerase sigma factor n=1 Tax=Nocardia sp. BMG51109 TaxID=1056816 RepID=UPI00046656BC|nr:sigma-70 family RNA polymerase sigma factor [Nocardia sp. BMG51109]
MKVTRRPRQPRFKRSVSSLTLLEDLYRRHREVLKTRILAATLGDSSLTDDVVHDTFERLFDHYGTEKIAQLNDARTAQLLKTIAHNCLVDAWRKDAKLAFWQTYADTAIPLGGIPASDTEHIDRLVNEELALRLSEIAEKHLTPGEWRVGYMSWFMGKSDPDIAQELGTTVRTVQTHRSSACKKLRSVLKKDGYGITFLDTDTGQSSPTTGIGEVTV